MKRREFIALVGGVAVAWPLAARAQQQDRVRRVGVLMGLPAGEPGGQSEAAAFNENLRALGWVEGRNLALHYNWSGGEPARIQAAAKELVASNCEVIVGRSTPVVAALMKETRTIPIVFTIVVDPVGSGFAQSFARPGGNVTGFQNYEFTMIGKWVQTLAEIAPSIRRIAYLYNPTTVPSGFLRAVETTVPLLSLQLIAAPVESPAEIETAFAKLALEPGGGLITVPDIFVVANRVQIIAQAAKHRVPAMYSSALWAKGDGLMSYGPDSPICFVALRPTSIASSKARSRAIFRSRRRSNMSWSINLKTAKTLGLTVPPTLLARADEVIE